MCSAGLSAVAELCKGTGMEVWGLTRTSSCSGQAYIDHSCQLDELPKLLAASDYVCNVLPSTSQTKGLLNGDMLQHCAAKVGGCVLPSWVGVGGGESIA